MEGSQASDELRTSDRSRAAVEFAHRLLSRAATSLGLDAVAAELAEAFAVGSAGMADLQSGLPLVLHNAEADAAFPEAAPWESDPELLARLRKSAGAVRFAGSTYAFLAVAVSPPVGGGWLLWVGDAARNEWTPAEA